MGLMQRAVETFDCNANLVGVYREGHEPLCPIGHTLTKASIEITLDKNGSFLSARKTDKDEPKILIPVTEASGGRGGTKAYENPHPLCDRLKYLTAESNFYIPRLKAWEESSHGHPFLKPILRYTESRTILADLTNAVGAPEKDSFICWRINGFDGEEPACWKNKALMDAYTAYYTDTISDRKPTFCMIDGIETAVAVQHPRNIIAISDKAKLISANDTKGFTYRGRFTDDTQAATVGYATSQKAHNAIRWLASEQGVRESVGNRVFLCWNPRGAALPKPMRRLRTEDAPPKYKPSDYREELRNTLYGFHRGNHLKDTDTVVLTAFDAATTGRLAVAYYNEFSLGTFLKRLEAWDAHCCWYCGKYGIQAPDLLQIVDCAFGTQREARLETDDRIQRQHLQRLLDCKVSGGVMPADIVRALVQRASTPLGYKEDIWRKIVHTACAALQKYRQDTNRGGNEMAWELDREDRSFQYGRLLAVMERAEADYYGKTQESRQTNAVKFMAEFRQRPYYVFERVNRQLQQAYLSRIAPWQRARYERLVGEISGILSRFPEAELGKPLDDIYLMGYELQRNAFFTKKETTDNETEE